MDTENTDRRARFPVVARPRLRAQLLRADRRASNQRFDAAKRWVAKQPGWTRKTQTEGRVFQWWPDPESNWGHKDFQSSALPTELSGRPKER